MTFSPSWYVTSAPPDASGASFGPGAVVAVATWFWGPTVSSGATRSTRTGRAVPLVPLVTTSSPPSGWRATSVIPPDVIVIAFPTTAPVASSRRSLVVRAPVLLLYSTVISASATRKTHEVMYLLPSATVRTGPDGSPAASTVRTWTMPPSTFQATRKPVLEAAAATSP